MPVSLTTISRRLGIRSRRLHRTLPVLGELDGVASRLRRTWSTSSRIGRSTRPGSGHVDDQLDVPAAIGRSAALSRSKSGPRSTSWNRTSIWPDSALATSSRSLTSVNRVGARVADQLDLMALLGGQRVGRRRQAAAGRARGRS